MKGEGRIYLTSDRCLALNLQIFFYKRLYILLVTSLSGGRKQEAPLKVLRDS